MAEKLLYPCTTQFVTDEEGDPNNNEFIIQVTITKGSSDAGNLREASTSTTIMLKPPDVVRPKRFQGNL